MPLLRFLRSSPPLIPLKILEPVPGVSTREIWALTWPQALMMLFQFFVGFTDVVIAGRINADVQAVLGVITQFHFFLLVVVMALCNGGIAAMSQALGAKLPRRAERYIGLILVTAAGLCLLTISLGYIFRHEIFIIMKVPSRLMPLTESMWVIFLCVIPANYIIVIANAIFRSRKNVWMPLFSGIVVCLVNIFFDFGLGLGYFGFPDLGGRGIAYATVLAVSTGAAFNAAVLLRSKLVSLRSFAPWRWQKRALPYIAKVALPAGGLQLLWQLGYLVLFFITATLPADPAAVLSGATARPDNSAALAGLAAGMRIEAILFLPGLAFSFTGSILVGHCLGAGAKDEARRVALKIITAGALCMSCVAAVLYLWLDVVVAFVTPDPAVQPIALSYMHYNLLSTPFTVASMIFSGIMTGAGATVYTFVIYTFATWCIRLPLAWYVGHILWQSASGVFLAMLVSQMFQALTAAYVIFTHDWYRFASTAKRFTRERA